MCGKNSAKAGAATAATMKPAKDGELSEVELDNILHQCRDMGNYFVVLTGGEPYLRKHILVRLFRKYRDMFFLTYTNGTLFDEALADSLAALGNVAPAISVEGYQAETDRRRGEGVHARIERSMEMLKSRGVMFGISATDPGTFVFSAMGLAMAAVLAAYGPARRASRIDPVHLLR